MLYDYVWKIIIAGKGGVGKTTLLHRYLHEEFIENLGMTIGVQIHSSNIIRQNKKISLVFWDLGGQERFRFIQGEYVRGGAAAMVFFDMSNPQGFPQVREWVEMIRKYTFSAIPTILIGAKLDLVTDVEESSEIHERAAKLVQDLYLVCYTPTSSKWGINVHETMNFMVDLLIWNAFLSESDTRVPQVQY